MNLNDIPFGTPEEFNVLIEIPVGSANKYEFDEEIGTLKLDFVFSNLRFPCNYGLIPHTLGGDGDHLDALVISSEPLTPGAVVTVRPVGLLKTKDRGEQDDKIIAVPIVDPFANTMKSISDVQEQMKKNLVAFYREVAVQKKKTIEIEGFFDRDEAIAEVKRCQT